jgi:Zn-dependent oligopeptidase
MMFYSGENFENKEELDKKFLEKVNKFSIFKREKNYKMYCSFKHIFSG